VLITLDGVPRNYRARAAGELAGFSLKKLVSKVVSAPIKAIQTVQKKIVQPVLKAPLNVARHNKKTIKTAAKVAAVAGAAYFGAPFLPAIGGAIGAAAPALLQLALARRAAGQEVPPDMAAQLPPEYQAMLQQPNYGGAMPTGYAPTQSGGGGGSATGMYDDDDEPAPARPRKSNLERAAPWVAAGALAGFVLLPAARRRRQRRR
jgi:hypothetical protein